MVGVKRRTLILGLGFAVLVYLVLFFYVFGLSPMITSSSQSKWVEMELSKEPKFARSVIISFTSE